MSRTRHFSKRMNERGINQRLVSVTSQFGKTVPCKDGKKIFLNRKGAGNAIKCLDRYRADLAEVEDKGGLVVVESDDGSQITVYRLDSYRRRGRKR